MVTKFKKLVSTSRTSFRYDRVFQIKLNQSAKPKVRLRNQPAVDTGGVLRHVFSKCFEYMVEGSSLPPFLEGIL